MSASPHAVCYEIRVERHLGTGITALFPGFTFSEEAGITVMRGEVTDQSALHGIMECIWSLGLTLISVQRINDGQAAQDE